MLNPEQEIKPTKFSSLNASEAYNIEQKVQLELNNALCKMIRVSPLINAFIGFFIAWTMRHQVPIKTLVIWYIALITMQLINVAWSYYYEANKSNPKKLRIWRAGYLIILAGLSLVWGSIGIFFITGDIRYQIYIITCLQIALIAFNVGAMIDFLTTVINTICLLLPYSIYNLYNIRYANFNSTDVQIQIAFGVTFAVLGIFLLITTFVGSRVLRRFFTLIFENVALSQKLEIANKSLEQRVKERTIELEDSLKLVTYQASHDLLTDLPNQRLLLEYLNAAVINANPDRKFAVVFFSLNELKKITDALGYQVSDTVMRTVAQRFKNTFSNKTHLGMNFRITLSRRDIFIILVEPIYTTEDIEHELSVLFSILDKPIYAERKPLKLTASIGVGIYPDHSKEIKQLLMHADIAMLQARHLGGNNLWLYKADMNVDIPRQLEIESHMHSALTNNEFILQYQPIVNIQTGEIFGAEALVRWQSPVLGYVLPQDFIFLAETNGMIIPLGNWIIKTVCEQLKKWHEMGFRSLHMAINISAKQLHKQTVIATFEKVLAETELNPEFIEIELTETIAFQEDAVPILKQLKNMGFSISIDDFGTGYSGLSNLKLFNIDTLKIDKIFVSDIETNIDSTTIVSNTIALAKQMGFSTIAEGVETKEQLRFLKEKECEYMQGYYFSCPVDEKVFTKLLKNHKNLQE